MSVVGNHEIEQALYDMFTVSDEIFQKVEVGQFPESLVPGLNVAVMRGRFSREDLGSYRQQVDIVLLIAAQNISSESECRKIIHPLVEFVVRKLVGSTLGLDIEPITPEGWEETTNDSQHELGEVIFAVRFSTASSIPDGPIEEEDEAYITELLAEYALLQKGEPMPPPAPDGEKPPTIIESSTAFEADQGAP